MASNTILLKQIHKLTEEAKDNFEKINKLIKENTELREELTEYQKSVYGYCYYCDEEAKTRKDAIGWENTSVGYICKKCRDQAEEYRKKQKEAEYGQQ